MVNLRKLRPSAGWSILFSGISPSPIGKRDDEQLEYILTVFFDHGDQLYEVCINELLVHA